MRTQMLASLVGIGVLGVGLLTGGGCAVAGIDSTPNEATDPAIGEVPPEGLPSAPIGSGDNGYGPRDASIEDAAIAVVSDASQVMDAATIPNQPNQPNDAGGPGPMSDAGSGSGTCTTAALCSSTTIKTTISGDNPGNTIALYGTTSQWIKIRVTENDDGGFLSNGVPLRIALTLTSPAGSNFDLFLYSAKPLQCTTPSFSSTKLTSDSIATQWGESETSFGDNNSDDSRDIIAEVRYVGGTCPTVGNWKLSMIGDQH
jgi:hypothetical protein